MDNPESEDLQRLNDRARDLYNKGDYGGAKRLWEEVLKADPANTDAAEGFRMVNILTEDWALFEPSGETDEMERRVSEIHGLLQSGQVEEAVSKSQALLAQNPDEPQVKEAHAAAMRAYDSEPFIREQLGLAREAISESRRDEAREFCRKILSIDGGNLEARELLLEIERAGEGGGEAAEAQDPVRTIYPMGGSGPAPGGVEVVFEKRDVEPGSSQAGTPPMPRSPESASGGLFESPEESKILDLGAEGLDLDLLDEEISNLGVDPLRSGPPAADPGAGAGQAASPPAGPPAVRPPAEPSVTPEPEVTAPAPADPPSIDLDLGSPAGPPPAATPPPVPEEEIPLTPDNIPKLIGRAQAELEAGRFNEAIACASRAFVIDAEHAEATRIVAEARRGLEQQAKEIELEIQAAHDAADSGNADRAREIVRGILDKSPGHQEALALLETLESEESMDDGGTIPLVNAPPAAKPDAAKDFSGGDDEAPLDIKPSTPLRKPEGRARPDARTRPPVAVRQARRGFSPVRLILFVVPVALVAGAWLVIQGGLLGSGAADDPGPAGPGGGQPPAPAAGDPGGTAQPPPSAAAPGPTESPGDLIQEGRKALREGRLKDAVDALKRASLAEPDNLTVMELLSKASARYEKEQRITRKMESARAAFEERRYADCLRILYRLPEEMQQGDVERYKRNAWYNIGVIDLQGFDPTGAVDRFDEALQIDPGDKRAAEVRKFAVRYQEQEKDSVYRRFVEALALREIDAR